MQGTSGTSAFTGCDSVSAFAGIGKVRPLNLLRCKKEFQVMFQDLGEQWSATEEMYIQLESLIVSAMYGVKKGNQDINQCRYAVFYLKKGETACTIIAREPITRRQYGRMHLPTTKFQVRLARDGF